MKEEREHDPYEVGPKTWPFSRFQITIRRQDKRTNLKEDKEVINFTSSDNEEDQYSI